MAKKKRGPKPEHLAVEDNWEDAVGKALKKQKPPEGWPNKGKKKKS